MSKEELLKRVFAQELSIRLNDIEQSSLSSVDKQRIQDLIVRADERLLISDDPNMDVDDLRRFIVNARKSRPVDVVVVDYLQIVNIKGRFQDKRVKTDAVTIALKRIAREFDVAENEGLCKQEAIEYAARANNVSAEHVRTVYENLVDFQIKIADRLGIGL